MASGVIANSKATRRIQYKTCLISLIVYFFILLQSNNVRDVIYDCPLYEMDKTPRKLCLFIMARLERPPTITALKMFPITLKTYLQVNFLLNLKNISRVFN